MVFKFSLFPESFSISDITFEVFCKGVAYGELPNKSSVLKIERGYKIPTRQDSPPILVYLISGSARIVVNGKGSIMAPFIFRNIAEGCSYSFENTGKETAILIVSSSEKIMKE